MMKRIQKKSVHAEGNLVLGAISIEDARRFVLDSVNLPWSLEYPHTRSQFENWLKRWRTVFSYGVWDGNNERKRLRVPDEWLQKFAAVVSATLRRIWTEKDQRQRDWLFYSLRNAHHQMLLELADPDRESHTRQQHWSQRMTDSSLQTAPEPSPFEAAIYWLQTQQKLMRFCPNPLCEGSHDSRLIPPGPWFFRTRKSEKYCSPDCGNPARREAKRLWWASNRGKGKRSTR